MKGLISIKKRIVNRLKYPHAEIHPSATIAKDVTLEHGVSIGVSSSVRNSTLGIGTTIHANCSLNGVTSENSVALYSHGKFHEMEIGSCSYIAPQATVSMAKIGRFCSIGPSLLCGYGDHPVDWVSTSPVFFSTAKQCGVTFAEQDLFVERKSIVIGHDVWIGARVFIRDGVKIGNGAIIAAGSVVVKDVPDYAIVGGVPAKVIRYRFPADMISSLLALAWWNWPQDKLKSARDFFSQSDVGKLIAWAQQNE